MPLGFCILHRVGYQRTTMIPEDFMPVHVILKVIKLVLLNILGKSKGVTIAVTLTRVDIVY